MRRRRGTSSAASSRPPRRSSSRRRAKRKKKPFPFVRPAPAGAWPGRMGRVPGPEGPREWGGALWPNPLLSGRGRKGWEGRRDERQASKRGKRRKARKPSKALALFLSLMSPLHPFPPPPRAPFPPGLGEAVGRRRGRGVGAGDSAVLEPRAAAGAAAAGVPLTSSSADGLQHAGRGLAPHMRCCGGVWLGAGARSGAAGARRVGGSGGAGSGPSWRGSVPGSCGRGGAPRAARADKGVRNAG